MLGKSRGDSSFSLAEAALSALSAWTAPASAKPNSRRPYILAPHIRPEFLPPRVLKAIRAEYALPARCSVRIPTFEESRRDSAFSPVEATLSALAALTAHALAKPCGTHPYILVPHFRPDFSLPPPYTGTAFSTRILNH
jgi:hypothetical protein